jgi:ATP-binding cassette, subfamily C (CFTR/MRP), member 1
MQQSFASLRASRSLHDDMAEHVMRAPMGWFERTPMGRILNRFSSDMQEIDKVYNTTYYTTIRPT